MRLLLAFILSLFCIAAESQTTSTRNWVDTQSEFPFANGKIVIHSSLPKGGGQYIDSIGTQFSYVIFWFRVINESTVPSELSVKLPTDAFKIFPSPNSHIRLFLPPDKMTPDKIPLFDYGLDLKSFLDTDFNKSGSRKSNINPKEELYFYVPVLFNEARGSARAALVLKDQDLFFKISVAPDVNSALIPAGRLVLKK